MCPLWKCVGLFFFPGRKSAETNNSCYRWFNENALRSFRFIRCYSLSNAPFYDTRAQETSRMDYYHRNECVRITALSVANGLDQIQRDDTLCDGHKLPVVAFPSDGTPLASHIFSLLAKDCIHILLKYVRTLAIQARNETNSQRDPCTVMIKTEQTIFPLLKRK